MSNRLTIKGQVTIPKDVREFLGLTMGASAVEFFIAEDGTVQVRKAQTPGRISATGRETVKTCRTPRPAFADTAAGETTKRDESTASEVPAKAFSQAERRTDVICVAGGQL